VAVMEVAARAAPSIEGPAASALDSHSCTSIYSNTHIFYAIYNVPGKVSLSRSAFPGSAARQQRLSSSPGTAVLVVVVFHPWINHPRAVCHYVESRRRQDLVFPLVTGSKELFLYQEMVTRRQLKN